MAIVFFEEQKKQQYLILVFGVVILATVTVFWFGVFQRPPLGPLEIPESPYSKKVEINFEVFKNPALSKMELFSEIQPFAGAAGRENPFLFFSPSPSPPTEEETE
jgi:hypothetical protein